MMDMKRLILLALGTALAISASAQGWQDALLYSENEYGGTARSMSMGNAFTAVGGDLGSIGINPAGSAVAGYSQVTITPGFSMSVSNSFSSDPDWAYGDKVHSVFTRMKMPNIGVVFALNTGRHSGLRRISFGFVSNSTSDFTSRMYATGINSSTSYCGSLASAAAGYPEAALSGYNADGSASKYTWWNLDEYPESYGLGWDAMVGYRSAMFGTVNGRYLGITDWDKDGKNTGVLAPLYQQYGFQTKGYKHDMVFNFAMDFGDVFYVGANFGITTLRYGQSEYWYEAPNNDAEFPAIPFDVNPNARFRSLEMKQAFDSKGVGAYFKIGMLWRLGAFRIGAALQTPTVMNINTRMAWSGKTYVDGVTLPAVQTPEWEDSYALVNPLRFNVGVAFTMGQVGILSADYEVADYGKCYFRSRSVSGQFYSSTYFDDVNADIRDVLGASHMLRVGAEFKLGPAFALRLGYNFASTAERNYLEWVYDPSDGKEHLKVFPLTAQERAAMSKHYVSVGAGYTLGSFFADLAVRVKMCPSSYFTPYYNYDYNGTDYTNKYTVDAVPEVVASYNRIEGLLTLGWRF